MVSKVIFIHHIIRDDLCHNDDDDDTYMMMHVLVHTICIQYVGTQISYVYG